MYSSVKEVTKLQVPLQVVISQNMPQNVAYTGISEDDQESAGFDFQERSGSTDSDLLSQLACISYITQLCAIISIKALR